MANNAITLHPFDAELMLRETADGALDASENTASVAVWGQVGKGLAAQIVYPAGATGTTPTVLAAVQLSTDDSTFYTVAQNVGGAQAIDATEGEVMIIPFVVPAGRYYARIAFTLAGTTPNFGTVIAGVIPNPGGEYDRQQHWV